MSVKFNSPIFSLIFIQFLFSVQHIFMQVELSSAEFYKGNKMNDEIEILKLSCKRLESMLRDAMSFGATYLSHDMPSQMFESLRDEKVKDMLTECSVI